MICIVDDDESVRTSLIRLMRSAGFSAEAFLSAEEFLQDAAAAAECRCVIIDVHLTGINGLELQHILNQYAVVPSVIVMTAFEDPELRRRALDAGAIAFLKKPFDDGVLLNAVARTPDRSLKH